MPTIREHNMVTNDFGTIHVPSTQYFSIGDEMWSCYVDGTEGPVQVLDLASAGNSVLQHVDVSEQIALIGSYHTSEQHESIEYQMAIDLVKSNLYFIWGSFEAGGLYMRRYSNTVLFGVMCGLATWSEYPHEGDLSYVMPESNIPFTISMLKQIGITFAGDDAYAEQRPSFYIYYKSDNSANGLWYKNIDTNNVQEAVYDEFPHTGSMSVATADLAWTDDFSFAWQIPPFEFEAKPCRVWGVGSYFDPVCTIFTPDLRGAIVVGSWDGGCISADDDDGGDAGSNTEPGKFPNRNNPIDFADPESMTDDAISSGFVTIFNPSSAEMRNFNRYLFSNDITEAISNQMKRIFANPYDYIINASMVHFTPERKETKTLINFCGFSSHVAAYEVTQQHQKVGPYTMSFYPNFNNFLDYNPYSKARLYLPYVGIVDLNIDDIMGTSANPSTLSIVYHVDMLSGGCVAELKVTRGKRIPSAGDGDCAVENVQQSWTGNVFSKMPLSSNDFSSLLNATLQFASGGVGMVSGNPIGGLGAMAGAVMSSKGTVQKSSSNTSSYGYINYQTPYLIIEYPIQAMPNYKGSDSYKSYIGRPSNIMNTVSYFTGYLETDPNTVWGDNITYTYGDITITAFDEEMDEIKELFNGGVYV